MRISARGLAGLCLVLTVWAAMVESVHQHTNQSDSAPCSICVVAHSSAPAIASHQSKPLFTTIGLLADEKITANAQLSFFELGIRGPPEA